VATWAKRLLRATVFVLQPFKAAGHADDAWTAAQALLLLALTSVVTHFGGSAFATRIQSGLAAVTSKPEELVVPGIVALVLLFVAVVKLQTQAEPLLEITYEARPPVVDVSRSRGDDNIAREIGRRYRVGVRNTSATRSITDVSVRRVGLSGRGETTGDTHDTRDRLLPTEDQEAVFALHPGESRLVVVVDRNTTADRSAEINLWEAWIGTNVPPIRTTGLPTGRYVLEIAASGRDAPGGPPRRFQTWVDDAGALRFEPV
jgi:hypothetical protein